MFVMKKIQLSIQQDHAKSLEIYMDSYLKEKPSNDGTYSNDPTVKSNCAGVGCATATFSQVISMCVLPVRVTAIQIRK